MDDISKRYRFWAVTLTLLFLSTAAPLPSSAAEINGIKTLYDICHARNGVLAWSRGIAQFCVHPRGKTRAEIIGGQKQALRECQRQTRAALPASMKGKIPCRIAFDGIKIVDPLLRSAMTRNPPIPVVLRIYDDATKKLQQTQGRVELLRIADNGSGMLFRIVAQGAALCNGSLGPSGRYNIKYNARCFGENFSGTARIRKVVQTGQMFQLVPQSVRVTSGKSYVEMFF